MGALQVGAGIVLLVQRNDDDILGALDAATNDVTAIGIAAIALGALAILVGGALRAARLGAHAGRDHRRGERRIPRVGGALVPPGALVQRRLAGDHLLPRGRLPLLRRGRQGVLPLTVSSHCRPDRPAGNLRPPGGGIALAAAIVLVVSAAVARLDDIPSLGAAAHALDQRCPGVARRRHVPGDAARHPVGACGGGAGHRHRQRRDWLLAGATVLTGFVAWFAAKGVKEVFERGRPLRYLPEIVVREGRAPGSGSSRATRPSPRPPPSWRSPRCRPRWRPVAVALAAIVGIGPHRPRGAPPG
jgi:hypothetical protein